MTSTVYIAKNVYGGDGLGAADGATSPPAPGGA